VYSTDLKNVLNLTQDNIDLVAAIGGLGAYLSFAAGFAFDWFGPRASTAVSMVLTCVGYLLMWAEATGRIEGNVSLLCFAAFLWNHGSAWADVTAITTQTRNFPQDRGLLIGVVKSFYGMSATMFAVAYNALYPNDPGSFLLFMAVTIPVLAGLGGAFQYLATEREALKLTVAGESRMKSSYLIVIVVGVFATVATAVVKTNHSMEGNVGWLVGVILFLLCFGLIAFPVLPWHREDESTPASTHPSSSTSAASLESDVSETLLSKDADHDAEEGREAAEAPIGASHIREDGTVELVPLSALRDEVVVDGLTAWQSVRTFDFVLMLLVLGAGTGSALTLINNIGQIATAMGEDSSVLYVALIGVGNGFGRMAFGYVSDAYSVTLSRPGWLACSMILLALSMLVNAFADKNVLYASVCVSGFAYGGLWATYPALVADRFGTKAYGTMYTLSLLSPAAIGVLLSDTLASAVYKANSPPGSNTCVGEGCFRTTFLVVCAISAVAAVLSVLLTNRMSKLYRLLNQAHFKTMGKEIDPELLQDTPMIRSMGSRQNIGAYLEHKGLIGDSPVMGHHRSQPKKPKKKPAKAKAIN
jgi:MFS family permease